MAKKPASNRKRKSTKAGDADNTNAAATGVLGEETGGPSAKSRKTNDDVSNASTDQLQLRSINTSKINQLASQIITAFYSRFTTSTTNETTNLLNECSDNGTLEKSLWPCFLRFVSAVKGSNGEEGGVDDMPSEQVAFALAVLSNRRGSSGLDSTGGGGDEQLWFVVDDYDYSSSASSGDEKLVVQSPKNISPQQRTAAFALLLKQLLSYQTNYLNCHNDLAIATQTEVVKFLIVSYSSMEIRCKKSSPPSHSDTTTDIIVQERSGTIEGPLTDLVGVRLWNSIPHRKRYLELKRDGLLRKRYGLFVSRSGGKEGGGSNVGFLPGMVEGILDALAVVSGGGGGSGENEGEGMEVDNQLLTSLQRAYVSKSLELILDLLSYPQTRTHVAPFLSSHHFAVKLALCKLYRDRSFVLFRQQVDMILDSERMEVATTTTTTATSSATDGEDGTPVEALPYNDVAERLIHQRAHTLQKLLHRHYAREASEVVFAGVGRVSDSKWLREKIGLWSEDTLYDVCFRLRLVDDNDEERVSISTAEFAKRLGCTRRELLTSILLYHQSSRKSDAAILSTAPLYPTESLLWDPHSVPPGSYGLVSNSESLSLPKLNTRFLSAGDYLLRNFRLFRLESAYEIRGDLVDAIKRMKPTPKSDGYSQENMADYYGGNEITEDANEDTSSKTIFNGWARMALELGSNKMEKQGLRLIRVDPPRLGERVPANVIAELVLDLRHCAQSLIKEWDEVGEFDNLFLMAVDASKMTGAAAPIMGNTDRRVPDEEDCAFPERYGVTAVRGCMVLEVRDEAGVLLSDPALAYEEGGKPQPKGKRRFLRVALDPAQYAQDATGHGSKLGVDVYDTFNLVVRRHGKENNFKAVLETIRGLMRGGANSMYRSIPSWLMPVLLGYGGDPSMASYSSLKMKAFASNTAGVTSPNAALDYGDTFIDDAHLRESFVGCDVTVDGNEISGDGIGSSERKKYRVKVVDQGQGNAKVVATSYPFPTSFNGNPIRFTPVQVKAIRSGLSPGLTTLIGPPGTGKTDVAVQIIANLYHSFPTQRTVIVTHSNAALNDIFDKVVARGDVDERYMLRLGSGERNLQTTSSSSHDFTKTGRVAHILSRRGDLLEKVQLLSESLGVSGASERGANGAPSYTCETSEYFFFHHVKKRMDAYESAAKNISNGDVAGVFPFKKFFHLEDDSAAMTVDDARTRFNEIKAVFDELSEYRPIELLRSQRQRTDYLLIKQARIVAMTCTHAAIARAHLVEVGFHYDNIIMEEAGQMLDVETFVPLLLQRGESDDSASSHSRLKRVCLIGDHNQLPPVVKNVSFSKYSHYDQSLFARLIRLGVPSIELNKQGRARPEIAKLYR